MRDQKFQQLIGNVEAAVSSETLPTTPETQVKTQSDLDILDQALEAQAPFRQFIKRHISTPKPSPALIDSIKERIRLQGLHD